MTTLIDRKRRPRRVAADEAHSWARHLKLRNTSAKLVLCMLTLYVDGEGLCFVSIPALAEDCELSAQTVRDRLAWLEELGVIARTPQWIDDCGHRNGNGKGRRTSDLIRLMIELDVGGIEARAEESKRSGTAQAEPDPQNVTLSPATGSDEAAEPLPSALPSGLPSALPSDSAEGLISEPEFKPEPESPPSPPLGDVRADQDEIQESEVVSKLFLEFWRGYPGHEVMSRARALEVFEAMTPQQQEHARNAAPFLAATLKKLERKPRDAHRWLAERGWLEYPQAAKSAPAKSERRMIKFAELASVQLALRIAGQRPVAIINVTSEETGRSTDGGFWGPPIGPDLLALAPFAEGETGAWHVAEEGSAEFAAWRDRLKDWLGCPSIEGEKIWLEPYRPEVHGLPGSDPNFKIRKSTRGLRVPRPFPPRKDGTWPPSLTPDDYATLAKEGQR